MSRYAQNTDVSSSKSRNEIEKTLMRYKADQFMYGWKDGAAVVGFRMNRLMIRFVLSMPDKADRRFTHTKNKGMRRSEDAVEREYEQAVRQRWRALALVIKAKLEAVESGISMFEEEFRANIVLPDNQTVSDFMLPQIAIAYERGDTPKMLPDYSGGV